MLREFEYGTDGLHYVKQELSNGWSLAQSVLKRPLESGRIISYLPESFSPADNDLLTGGAITTAKEGRELELKILQLISDHLHQKGKRLAIFEAYGHVGDPFLKKSALSYFSYGQGSEVYYFITPTDTAPEVILDALGKARRYPLVALLTSLTEDSVDIDSGKEIGGEIMEQFASRAEHLIFDVYDGEAYLIWSERSTD